MAVWWLCACAVVFGDLLPLWASHQHLERCQRQLFIKPGVLEPQQFISVNTNSHWFRWGDSSHYVMQYVGWFILFVSTDCYDGVDMEDVFAASGAAAWLQCSKKCQIQVAPSVKHAVRKRSSCLQVVLHFGNNMADSRSKRWIYENVYYKLIKPNFVFINLYFAVVHFSHLCCTTRRGRCAHSAGCIGLSYCPLMMK